ncbi:RDD family protein [Vibrio chagasii]
MNFAIWIDSIVFLPLEWIDDYVLSGVISSGCVFTWGVVNSLIGITYYVGMQAKFGQTIGKMVTRVKVVDVSESRNLTLKQSCMRDIVPIMLIPFSLYAYAQLSFYGQTWESLEQGRAFIFVGYAMIGWVFF